MLRNHITDRRTLGEIVVSDSDYSANVIDPGKNLVLNRRQVGNNFDMRSAMYT